MTDTPQDDNLSKLQHITDTLIEPELVIHVIENSPNALIVARKDGNILYVNRSAELLFGYSRQELFERPISVLVPERLRQAHEKMFAAYLDDPKIRMWDAALATAVLDKSGAELPIDIALVPVVIPAGFFVAAYLRRRCDVRPDA